MLLEVRNLSKLFPVRGGIFSRVRDWVQAVRGVDFGIDSGETLGLVGESGCGKSTVARLALRLIDPTEGQVLFGGTDLAPLSQRRIRPFRRQIQMIFQDPFSSLNPRMRAGEIIAEPLVIHRLVSRREKRSRVAELLERVGLPSNVYDRYPHEFSGGQRQRIGIARAIALSPKLIVADEPVSALDVSVAAQIVNLLADLQRDLGISYLFIAHDLRMVKYLSHRVAVMYLGKIVEMASKGDFDRPLHPYTQALVAAIPVAQPKTRVKKILLSGEIPSAIRPPAGCSFHTRCPYAEARCREEEPPLMEWGKGHWAACHFVEKINA